jgi:hypothetical protein
VLEHLLRHVPGQCHDGSVNRLRLGKLRDRVVSAIVKTESLYPGSRGHHVSFIGATLRQ